MTNPADEPPTSGDVTSGDVTSGAGAPATAPALTLGQLQDVIERTFGARDSGRGIPASVAWLCEEVGELAQAIRKGTPAQQRHEFADVVAWVVTLANQMHIDLDEAVSA